MARDAAVCSRAGAGTGTGTGTGARAGTGAGAGAKSVTGRRRLVTVLRLGKPDSYALLRLCNLHSFEFYSGTRSCCLECK